MKTLLGTGILGWSRSERITDRYGMIFLLEDDTVIELKPAYELQGQQGSLIALIKESRLSSHFGDISRRIFPPKEPPSVGQELLLGSGVLIIGEYDGEMEVGLQPNDERTNDWLDPIVLYQLHCQTIDLFFSTL